MYSEILYQFEELKKISNQRRIKYFGKRITASKNYFIPLIQYCRNNCLYCGFSRKNARDDFELNEFPHMIIDKEQYLLELKKAKFYGCREILIVLGDRPEEVSRQTRIFLENNNFESSLEYVYWACEEAIKLGLEPHINLGVLSKTEWNYFVPVIESAGLMLETILDLTQKNNAHQSSPDKKPKVRLDSIKAALELEIPFTSGLLLGIGEDIDSRISSLYHLQDLSDEFSYLQEVIIQGFHPLPNSPWRNRPPVQAQTLLHTISQARYILDSNVAVQFPPNLNQISLMNGILSGANDLGGVSPISIDHVNFTSPWPKWEKLRRELKVNNLELIERGPVHHIFLR